MLIPTFPLLMDGKEADLSETLAHGGDYDGLTIDRITIDYSRIGPVVLS